MKKKKLKAKLAKTKQKLVKAEAKVTELESKLAKATKPAAPKPVAVKAAAPKPLTAKPVAKAKATAKPGLASAVKPKVNVASKPRRPAVKKSIPVTAPKSVLEIPASTPEPSEEVVAAIERSNNDGDQFASAAAAGDVI
jgi:hypothetical protein